ncbi:MAG: GNAT family N-acetyltransferase [Bacteroidia bacterium]|nr:GNAT family N-acetyltransferase [Bacteroidia bacterium]
MKINYYTGSDSVTTLEKAEIVNFLFEHLDPYGDTKPAILNAIEYALLSYPMAGGFILISREDEAITGIVVMNKTGMEGYIPENILVYIAVHKEHRGKGIGKKLMNETIKMAKGDIALHVEPDNPARRLYERMNFTSKYLEMRLVRK